MDSLCRLSLQIQQMNGLELRSPYRQDLKNNPNNYYKILRNTWCFPGRNPALMSLYFLIWIESIKGFVRLSIWKKQIRPFLEALIKSSPFGLYSIELNFDRYGSAAFASTVGVISILPFLKGIDDAKSDSEQVNNDGFSLASFFSSSVRILAQFVFWWSSRCRFLSLSSYSETTKRRR